MKKSSIESERAESAEQGRSPGVLARMRHRIQSFGRRGNEPGQPASDPGRDVFHGYYKAAELKSLLPRIGVIHWRRSPKGLQVVFTGHSGEQVLLQDVGSHGHQKRAAVHLGLNDSQLQTAIRLIVDCSRLYPTHGHITLTS